ncbi:MAG TPA: hypothetical protein VN747_03400 [Burkholderiales bacterium]|nr:hypothetical protein [Burkholderiales bacterium]
MEKIIAGNFQTSVQADKAARALRRAGFPDSDVSVYANNPPGQHGEHPLGGDEHADPGSDKAAGGAAAGSLAGAAAGAAVGGAVGGALGAVAGAGVGAYAGSFGGAMGGLGKGGEPLERRPAGTMVAVRLAEPGSRETAIEKMSLEKPVLIEEADGEWVDGEWVDFDPVARPKIVWPTEH